MGTPLSFWSSGEKVQKSERQFVFLSNFELVVCFQCNFFLATLITKVRIDRIGLCFEPEISHAIIKDE